MKRVATMLTMALCFTMTVSAIVIHNDTKEEDTNVRSESGKYNDDYLFLGHELNFSGEAEDVVFLGKSLTFNGKAKLGVISMGEKLFISGDIGNGLIAAGMNVDIENRITGTSYIGCKSLHIGKDATVQGTLFTGCAKLILDGTLNGDLYAGVGELTINNVINGNVTVCSGRIIIGEHGKINGNLSYAADEKLSEQEAARVTGSIVVNKSCTTHTDTKFANFLNTIGIFICLGIILSTIISGLVLLFLPVFRKLDSRASGKTFWETTLWGLIPVLMYPAVVILCFALIVTIPFAIVLLLAFIPLFYCAFIIGTTLVGKYLVTLLKWHVTKRHYQFLIGILVCTITCFIPFVNFITLLLLCAAGWGVYVSFLFNKNMTITGTTTPNA